MLIFCSFDSSDRAALYGPSSSLHTECITSCFLLLPLYFLLLVSICFVFFPLTLCQVTNQGGVSACLTSASKYAVSPHLTSFVHFIEISGLPAAELILSIYTIILQLKNNYYTSSFCFSHNLNNLFNSYLPLFSNCFHSIIRTSKNCLYFSRSLNPNLIFSNLSNSRK